MARAHLQFANRVIWNVGGVNSNHVSHEWNFLWSGSTPTFPTVTELNALGALIQNFYSATYSGNKVEQFFGPQYSLTTGVHEIAQYDLDMSDIHHAYGSPVNVIPFSISTVLATTPYPNMCAAVISLRADYGTDPEHGGNTRPRADDRGRLYIGPLGNSAFASAGSIAGTTYSQLSGTFTSTLQAALFALHTAAAAIHWDLSVWSRKQAVFKRVIFYAIDNQVDIQRRRELSSPVQNWLPLP